MEPIKLFSLQRPAKPGISFGAEERRELVFSGQPTGVVVDGIWISAQYDAPDGFLLLLTEDSPYEEGLHIYLLDRKMKMLDAIHMGQPYAPGVLWDLASISINELQFSFFGNDLWRVRILEKPRRMMPLRYAPQVGIGWLRIFSKRYLELTRLKP